MTNENFASASTALDSTIEQRISSQKCRTELMRDQMIVYIIIILFWRRQQRRLRHRRHSSTYWIGGGIHYVHTTPPSQLYTECVLCVMMMQFFFVSFIDEETVNKFTHTHIGIGISRIWKYMHMTCIENLLVRQEGARERSICSKCMIGYRSRIDRMPQPCYAQESANTDSEQRLSHPIGMSWMTTSQVYGIICIAFIYYCTYIRDGNLVGFCFLFDCVGRETEWKWTNKQKRKMHENQFKLNELECVSLFRSCSCCITIRAFHNRLQ